jgi:O-antigen ligase
MSSCYCPNIPKRGLIIRNYFNTYEAANKQNWLLAVGLILSIVLGAGIVYDLRIVAGLLGIVIGAALVVKCSNDPFPIIILLLILRPAMGAIGDLRIGGVGLQMLSSILLFTGGLLYLYSHKKYSAIFSDIIVKLFLIYLMFNVLSFVLNEKLDIITSLSQIFRMGTYLFIYILARHTRFNENHIATVFGAIIVSSLTPNAIGFSQVLTGTGLDSRGVVGIYSTFFHPNMYANYLVIVCAANLYFISTDKYKISNILLLLFNVFLLTNCYARAALIALLILFGGVAFVKKRILILIGVIAILLFPLIFNDIYNSLYYRFVTVPTETGDYLSNRLYLWGIVIDIFKENWLIGVGPSLFYPYYHPWAAHNEILRNLVETGVIGTLSFILLWGAIVFKSIHFLKTTFSNENTIFSLILLGIIWLSLTSNLIICAEVLWLFWFLLGVVFSANERLKISDQQPTVIL